jgi:hypothetical protein
MQIMKFFNDIYLINQVNWQGEHRHLEKLTPASAFWQPLSQSGTGTKNVGLRHFSPAPDKFQHL